MSSHFIEDLNESQREAVTYCDGPSLVIAGAGAGKTRVLTYKIAYLITLGLPPWNILALTFTNKAAKEMKDRIGKLVDVQAARRIWMGTFHSLFFRILRTECRSIGFNPDLTIYDTSDAKSLVKAIVKELKLDDKVYKPSLVMNRISAAKNLLMLPEQYTADGSLKKRDTADNVPAIGDIYARYFARCKQANAMDFDDLLLYTYLLLHNHPEVLAEYKQRFRYVLVDEFQDTNYAQHRIISLLTDKDSRICVVGDDAQSIYGFRGADISNILGFTKEYPKAKLFRLECNYRSTGIIVEAANCVIKHNRNQIEKHVYSNRQEGEKICVLESYSDKDESAKVAKRINGLRRKSLAYSDIAILYRTNAQSRVFEETFRTMGIPYRIYGGLSFYQRKEIKDVLAYFRLVVNPQDEEAFKRIINYPARGIGATTQQKLANCAVTNGISLWQTLSTDRLCEIGINKGSAGRLTQFRNLIESYINRQESMSLYDLCLNLIKESGIAQDLVADGSPENISRKENVEELVNSIKIFEDERREELGDVQPTLSEYLSQISLLTDVESEDDENDAERVSLMTVHAAKGLEFDAVFVVGMEEDLFPNQMAAVYPKEMEEERRLFYVALTRAKTYCFLSYAKSRFVYGKMDFCNPSPFLKEIDDKYIVYENNSSRTGEGRTVSAFEPKHTATISRSLFGESRVASPNMKKMTTKPSHTVESGGGVKVGQRIKHERFGIGTVEKIENAGESYKATIDFSNIGTKVLLLKFARFEILE